MLSSRKKACPSFQVCQPEIIVLAFVGDEDAERLELAFSKKRIEERKAWLQGFEIGTFLDQSADEISYTDFVDKASVAADPIMLCILTESSCLYETIVWTPPSLQETLRAAKSIHELRLGPSPTPSTALKGRALEIGGPTTYQVSQSLSLSSLTRGTANDLTYRLLRHTCIC